MNTLKHLPESKIINSLISKSNSRSDYDFDYIHKLEDLRNRVSSEVSQINVLFPEYTPHDEQYHLKRLFYIADLLLGDELIECMNVTELFLLSISLYAHDWGMAVNEAEKEIILHNCIGNDNIHLLDDEKSRIEQFCKDRNIDRDKISIENWREYVRQTHALRSGKRIKEFFEPINTGIAEFASRICEGHWLDFDIIDDFISYPTDAAIQRETVNVKAITIYVRLIDLLDIGEDRTPYVLWKFVAPRNKFSKIEWSKHRALQPVTFPQYQHGRYIQVEGSTDDHNVYMSIMDLKRYVDDQFRQCNDTLNRINHNYHRLNISHLDWRIAARGFEPIAIQFEFDRIRMFDILGDEIYQSNPFVFVRELLQNAIDAIDMRKEILDKKDLTFKGKINITVIEKDEHFIVEVQDNGIGMDEYIIRNYLAVAGRSYYRSNDFYKEGLKMDPISRFGIGTLSCFMVADYIEIETLKEPHTTQKQESIFISIPAKENYFKISKNVKSIDVGTTFRIYVIKDKLPKNEKGNVIKNFNITSYIKQTAGFVKYPINISENGILTIVKNPNLKVEDEAKEFCVDYSFPIENAFLPQYVEIVKELFEEKRIYLKEDLKMSDYDGCLTFLLPIDENIDFINDSRSWPTREAKLINHNRRRESRKKIKWHDEWISFDRYYRRRNTSMDIRNGCFSVFLDGILLTDIDSPEISIDDLKVRKLANDIGLYDKFICPQLIVNIPKPLNLKIDLARKNIVTKERWDKPIWKAFYKYLKENEVENCLSLDLKQRLINLAKLVTYYQLSPYSIIKELISESEFPIISIGDNSNIIFKKFSKKDNQTILFTPDILNSLFTDLLISSFDSTKKVNKVINNWVGEDSVLNVDDLKYKNNITFSLANASILFNSFMRLKYYFSEIKFISSPLGNDYPLIQKVLKIKQDDDPNIDELFIEELDWNNVSDYNLYILQCYLENKIYKFPKIVRFPNPFSDKIFYSFKYLNSNSKFVQNFINLTLKFFSLKKKELIAEEILGKIEDLLKDIPFIDHDFEEKDICLSTLNQEVNYLFLEAIKYNIINIDEKNENEISTEDFVINSITIHDENHINPHIKGENYLKGENKWGELIS